MRQTGFLVRSILTFVCLSGLFPARRMLAQYAASKPDLPAAFLAPQLEGDRGSIFVPFDSWIYPAMARLFSLGYVDSAYNDMRPWTRLSCLHMLEETYPRLLDAPQDKEAWSTFRALAEEFGYDPEHRKTRIELTSIYLRLTGIAGPVVNNSFHFGQTLINDDGRPFQRGFNAVTGFSVDAAWRRLTLQARGEYQHAPGRAAYPQSVEALFAKVDGTPQLPSEPVPATNTFHMLNANLAFALAHHEISVGKMEDEWGPAQTGGMVISNNADPIYAFRVDRVDPLHVPLLSRALGPLRYEFIFGDLKGHRYPNQPWVHAEKFAFKPTRNLEFGFSRVVVFAGKDHVPLTFGSFWNSFTSFSDVSEAQKLGRNDPGARHSSFDFTWRLPYLEKWVTLYTDSIVHDDVSPLAAPRRAAVTPGIYLSRVPGLPHLDLRVEAVSTDPPASSQGGSFLYYESVYKDGYLNSGNFFGSWMGREGKGGQLWMTGWLSPKTYIQAGYRNAKVSKAFIPGGTTQNDFNIRAVLRPRKTWN